MRVLITGATGFIGSYLTQLLLARGDEVGIVSRDPQRVRAVHPKCEALAWPPDLSGFDGVINLAGESLFGKRWSAAQRARIKNSRIDSTKRLTDALANASPRPAVFINASAIGIYGDRGDELLGEDGELGDDYLSDVCASWEQAALRAEQQDVRTVLIRIGVVLGKGGGALDKMLLPFKLGLGGPMGSGKQWMSWIHIADLCGLFSKALDDEDMRGAFNGTAPTPVTNRDFAKALGKALGRPAFLPTPIPMLKLALGDVACLLSDSQRCSADKALAAGFEFEFPELGLALNDLLRRPS